MEKMAIGRVHADIIRNLVSAASCMMDLKRGLENYLKEYKWRKKFQKIVAIYNKNRLISWNLYLQRLNRSRSYF